MNEAEAKAKAEITRRRGDEALSRTISKHSR